MAVDATVPVLVSLVLLVLATAVAAVVNGVASRSRRRPVRSPRAARRAVSSALRCPRVVLIDDVARTGADGWAALAS